MLPLALPEPAGRPPALPASVAAPNGHAGVAADHSPFAAMVDADTSRDAGASVLNGRTPPLGIKQTRLGGGHCLLSKLAGSVPMLATDSTAQSITTPAEDSVEDAADQHESESSLDLPLDLPSFDLSSAAWPTLRHTAIHIPIPGDEEEAEGSASVQSADQSPAGGVTPPAGFTGLLEAARHERASAGRNGAATYPGGEAGGQPLQPLAEGGSAGPSTLAAGDSVEAFHSQPATGPIVATPAAVVGSPVLPDVGHVPTGAGGSGEATATDAPIAEQPAPTSSHPSGSARSVRGEERSVRSVDHAGAAQGPLRSPVASAVTTADTPADAAHAAIDSELTPAASAQHAPATTREIAAARPSEPPSRHIDATASGLPFSTDRDASESGPREEEARGRQTSAMSARLAAAVASTSEPPSAHAAAASPVFAIPTVQTTTSQPMTAPLETQTASAPALPPENVERLVQTMQVNVKSGVMEATVRLRPEYLGEVTIQLRVDGSTVTAVVQTETPAVKQWLESQEQTIRNGLAAHGLDLERLIVNPDGERQQQPQDESEANESRRRAYRRRQQSAERFEITV